MRANAVRFYTMETVAGRPTTDGVRTGWFELGAALGYAKTVSARDGMAIVGVEVHYTTPQGAGVESTTVGRVAVVTSGGRFAYSPADDKVVEALYARMEADGNGYLRQPIEAEVAAAKAAR